MEDEERFRRALRFCGALSGEKLMAFWWRRGS